MTTISDREVKRVRMVSSDQEQRWKFSHTMTEIIPAVKSMTNQEGVSRFESLDCGDAVPEAPALLVVVPVVVGGLGAGGALVGSVVVGSVVGSVVVGNVVGGVVAGG
jgi:hypothetical protein